MSCRVREKRAVKLCPKATDGAGPRGDRRERCRQSIDLSCVPQCVCNVKYLPVGATIYTIHQATFYDRPHLPPVAAGCR